MPEETGNKGDDATKKTVDTSDSQTTISSITTNTGRGSGSSGRGKGRGGRGGRGSSNSTRHNDHGAEEITESKLEDITFCTGKNAGKNCIHMRKRFEACAAKKHTNAERQCIETGKLVDGAADLVPSDEEKAKMNAENADAWEKSVCEKTAEQHANLKRIQMQNLRSLHGDLWSRCTNQPQDKLKSKDKWNKAGRPRICHG